MSRKSYIRGTLTNGYEWLFLVLNINSNGKGPSNRISDRSYSAAPHERISDRSYSASFDETGVNMGMVILNMASDMIAGILTSWCVANCFECPLRLNRPFG